MLLAHGLLFCKFGARRSLLAVESIDLLSLQQRRRHHRDDDGDDHRRIELRRAAGDQEAHPSKHRSQQQQMKAETWFLDFGERRAAEIRFGRAARPGRRVGLPTRKVGRDGRFHLLAAVRRELDVQHQPQRQAGAVEPDFAGSRHLQINARHIQAQTGWQFALARQLRFHQIAHVRGKHRAIQAEAVALKGDARAGLSVEPGDILRGGQVAQRVAARREQVESDGAIFQRFPLAVANSSPGLILRYAHLDAVLPGGRAAALRPQFELHRAGGHVGLALNVEALRLAAQPGVFQPGKGPGRLHDVGGVGVGADLGGALPGRLHCITRREG